jgi:Bacterial regulatory proteins, luxR family
MITAIVQYKLPPHIGLADCAAHFRTIAPDFRDVPGLIRKQFIYAEDGRSNRAIAESYGISERVVQKHVGNIFSKLGLPPSDADHRRVLAVLRYLED